MSYIYIYIYIYIYNTDKKKIITQNIHANCFRWDYDLHACVLHSHETPKFQNDRGGTDPTDWFQWIYAFYTIEFQMVILPNSEEPAVSVWPFKINQYIGRVFQTQFQICP